MANLELRGFSVRGASRRLVSSKPGNYCKLQEKAESDQWPSIADLLSKQIDRGTIWQRLALLTDLPLTTVNNRLLFLDHALTVAGSAYWL
jgi:hypothetical protein